MQPSDANLYRGVLENSIVFRGLPPATLEQIMEQGMLLEARKGADVFFENMRGGFGLYVILEGRLEVFRAAEPGEQGNEEGMIMLNTLGMGQTLGEYSLIDGLTTSASARAQENSRLFFLPRGKFDEVMDSDPLVAKAIYRNLLLYLIDRLRHKG